MVRILPNYSSLDIPRGSRRVLKSLIKTAAKKLTETENIRFDHKDSLKRKLTADQIAVIESSQELFAEFFFESKLDENFAFALRYPVGDRIFKIITGWNKFADFEDITYHHARELKSGQRPYHNQEMMKAPRDMFCIGVTTRLERVVIILLKLGKVN